MEAPTQQRRTFPTFSVYMDDETVNALDAIAQRRTLSRAALIREIVTDWLSRQSDDAGENLS